MAKKAIAVIGEGITEKYYIKSITRLSDFNVKPRELGTKASSLKKLETNIKNAIADNYDEVYCLIDMDGKRVGKVKEEYIKLKQACNKTHCNKETGISCKVLFIESERCTELWFLYHFLQTATTCEYSSYEKLEKELQKYLPNYEKKDKYFRSVELHDELTNKKGGTLSQAIKNAKSSLKTKEITGHDHTYTEMHILIEALGIVTI